MRVLLSVLPYGCIIAYIIFIFISVHACNVGIDQFYEGAYNVTREVGEVRARMQELRSVLSRAFADPEKKLADIEPMLNEHNRLQDVSLAIIRQNFPKENRQLIDQMNQEVDALRKARLEVARELEGNADHDLALSQYTRVILPPLSLMDAALIQISAAAAEQSAALRHDFIERHQSTEAAAVLLGIFLFIILLYNHLRDVTQQKAILHREKLFNILSQTIEDVFIISNSRGELEYASDNSIRSLHVSAREIVKKPRLLYNALGSAGAWLKARLGDRRECEVAETQTAINAGQTKIRIKVYPVCDKGGAPERHIAVISDETEAMARCRRSGFWWWMMIWAPRNMHICCFPK